MRLIAWNLNHRAARRRIPDWVSTAISAMSPDTLVLTEYVEGPDHNSFLGELSKQGLQQVSTTVRPARQNQVLIATREPHTFGELQAPPIHAAVPSNVLHVRLDASGLQILGFRMPAFKQANRGLKRQTWEWLHSAAAKLRDFPAMIVGD